MAASRDPFDVCGTTIDGKYRVVSLIGEGGFGVVYQGVHVAFDEPIAIKCLKFPATLDDDNRQQLLERLKEEGRLLHRLSKNTSSIVQALDVGAFTTSGGQWVPYMVLEWLEGETLTAYLARRRARGESISLQEAVKLLEPAARALALAHAQKVVHRDVKPENLFVMKAGGPQTLKVLDFGIAKALTSSPAFTASLAATQAGPSAFTPRYGAPEQFNKKRGATGPWTDVFALALVFIEAIAGKPALEGDDVTQLFMAASDPGLRPTPKTHGLTVPDAVERVLEVALAVEPRARYADAGVFWDALVLAVNGESVASMADCCVPKPLDSGDELLSTAEFAAKRDIGFVDTAAESAALRGAKGEGAAAGESVSTEKGANTEGLATTVPAKSGSELAASDESLKPAPMHATTRGSAVLRTEPSAPVAPPTKARRFAIAAAALLAVVGTAGLALRNQFKDAPVQAAPALSASVAPVVPQAVSENAEAAQLYQQALQAYRDGATESAVRTMRRAIALDKNLLAGRLRIAFWRSTEARDEVTTIQPQRAKLSARDQALFEAAEPYLRQPWDIAGSEAKLVAALERFPQDAEFLIYLGAARIERYQYDAAIEAFDKALAADPDNRTALVQKARALAIKGDTEGARQAYASCIDRAPGATVCLSARAYLLGRIGDCKGMEEDARRVIAVDPQDPKAYGALAMALAANGAKKEAIVAVQEQGWSRLPEAERDTTEKEQRAILELITGDFTEAARLMRIWQSDLAGRNDQFTQSGPAQRLALLYTEMGDRAAAGKVAQEFLAKIKAWTEPAGGGGASIALLPFALRAGAISKEDLERERKAWQEKLRNNWANTRGTGPALDWNLWFGAYACPVETPEEATEALEHMPTSPPPPPGARTLDSDACFGKTLLLAKQYDRAIDPLRRVAHSCGALSVPFHYMQSQLNLGLALEASGDKEGAKVLYRMVVDLWGKAKPRSVTAEAAHARLSALEGTNPTAKKESAPKREGRMGEEDSGYSVSGRQTSRSSLPSGK